jgi:hypothetical protein
LRGGEGENTKGYDREQKRKIRQMKEARKKG